MNMYLTFVVNYSNYNKLIYVSVFFSLPVGADLPIYYTHKQAMDGMDEKYIFI